MAISGTSNPTHAVDVEGGLERAIAALDAHATYLDALSGDMANLREFLTSMATSTGERFGNRLATSFHVLGDD